MALIHHDQKHGDTRRKALTRLLAGFAVAGTALAAGPFTPPAAAATTVAVDAGFGGLYVPGRAMPVRVTIEADRLVAGTIQVVVDRAPPFEIPVEVPGGSRKEVVVAVPTTPTARTATITARIADGTSEAPSGQVSVLGTTEEELVGLLPGAAATVGRPGAAPLAVDAGTARFFALSEAELAQGPASLQPLGTILAAASDLDGLAPGARAAVLGWLERGGRLVVAAAPGQPVAGLPDAWQPGAAARARAGSGEVRLVGPGALTAPAGLGRLIEPTARGGGTESIGFTGPGDLSFSLASEAGFRVPRLGWLMAFLVGYVLLVGPVLYLVLRRRRRPELAWVAVPLVALLFAGGAYVAGNSVRTATPVVHATVLTTSGEGTSATTWLGVTSRRGETVGLGFPGSWIPVYGPDQQSAGAGVAAVAATPDSTVARMPLDAGQFGVMAATGPVASPGRLEISARVGPDGGWEGTVRNGLPWRLDEVAAVIGSSATMVGGLDAGAEREWTMARFDPFSGGPPGVWQLWANFNDPFGRGPGRDGATDLSLWGAAQASDPRLQSSINVVAAGWTRAYDPPVRAARSAAPDGRTLVLGISPVTVAGTSVDVEVVRGGNARFNQPRNAQTVARLTALPSDTADLSRLSLRVPMPNFEVWAGGNWTPVDCTRDCAGVAVQGANVGGPGFAAARAVIVAGGAAGVGPVPAPFPTVVVAPGAPPPLPVPLPCPPGADCGFGVQQFVSAIPAGAWHDGAVFVRVPALLSAESFGLEAAA